MDLNDEMFERRMTFRRFAALLSGLPAESAFAAHLRWREKRKSVAEWGDPSSVYFG